MKLLFSIFLFAPVLLFSQVNIIYDIEYDDIPGVDPNLLSLDVYDPAGEDLKPIAIYIHGGGWCIGDKKNVHEKAEMLTDLGYVFISINYRLSPFPYELDNPDRIKYPDHPQDIVKAISFIFDNADQFDGDLENVFLFGHSTGAHLAASVLTDPSFWTDTNYSPEDIKCSCIMDTGGFDLDTWITESATDADLFINAFSDDPLIWAEASPLLNIEVDEKLPEILLIYQNNIKRILANQEFAKEIREKTGTEVSELSTSFDHQQINQLLGDQSTEESEIYTANFLEWLTPCMALPTATKDVDDTNKKLVKYNISDSYLELLTDHEVHIYNYAGKLMKRTNRQMNRIISVSDFPVGMYFLMTEMGESQRIVVTR